MFKVGPNEVWVDFWSKSFICCNASRNRTIGANPRIPCAKDKRASVWMADPISELATEDTEENVSLEEAGLHSELLHSTDEAKVEEEPAEGSGRNKEALSDGPRSLEVALDQTATSISTLFSKYFKPIVSNFPTPPPSESVSNGIFSRFAPKLTCSRSQQFR